MRRAILSGALAAAFVAGSVSVALAGAGSLPVGLQAVRAAVAPYHSYNVAQDAGYSAEPVCVASPAGVMGFHAPNLSLLASGDIDPLKPPILLYVPRADGLLKLVGVEYFRAALVNTPDGPRPWFGSTDPRDLGMTFAVSAPSLFGHTFDGPMAGHNPSMPWHYDLHVWVAEENPAGLFAQFNPALSCD
jgi:hypothetical protein